MTLGAVAPVVDALKGQAGRHFGEGPVAFEPVELFDGPFSTVVRLRVHAAAGASHVFAKVYKPRKAVPYETPIAPDRLVVDEFDATERLHRALASRPGLAAARPIACFPEYAAIVTEELRGRTVNHLIAGAAWGRRVSPSLEVIGTRIGAWLRTYQRSGAGHGGFDAGERRRYLDDRLRHITPRFLRESDRASALALFDRLAPLVDGAPETHVPVHADLCPGNIVVTTGGAVGVLDFATAQSGSRYHDLAHLYLHLLLAQRRWRMTVDVIDRMKASLLAGFEDHSTGAQPMFRLMLLQHVVCHVTELADRLRWRPENARRHLIQWRWRRLLRSASGTA